ncbi:hypothetical protein Tco_0925820 [Tanacetum coccineum]|uniref:Uncharacterized protein n=1 Tax=Tanacetum coccineum TaxID=301880 RepID=A0ABQ5DAY5_9ASTR
MVTYLEKTDGNAEFHEIVDFLTRSSIHYALTVSPVVSTTFVKQFWMTAKSKTINNVRYITATVAGKPVSISEASIRSDLQLKKLPGIDGKKNSGNVTPLFPSMLAQPIKDEEGSGGNHGGQSSSDRSLSGNKDGLTLQSVYDLCVSLCKQVTTQAAQINDLKAQIKQLKKKAKPIISHHNAWIKSVSMKKRLARKKSLKTKLMQNDSVSKQGRKPAKSEPTVHKDPAFDDLDDAIDYMEPEDAHDEGTVKDSEETRVSTEEQVSTDKLKVSTDKPNEGTAEPTPTTSGALRRRVMVLAPGQPIPHGRPYRYHFNRSVHMMIVKKRVGSLPTRRLVVRHSVDYSSLGYFSSDDSSSSSSPSHDSSSASHSRMRSRSPVASVLLSSPTLEALSYACADLLPSPKRIRSPETATDLKDCLEDSFESYVPREMDVDVVRSDGIEIELEIQAEIDECFAYADALRDRGIDARVVVKAVDREESKTGTRGPIEVRLERVTHLVMPDDTPEPAQEGAVEVTYETLGDLVQRFYDHTEAIPVHRIHVIEGALREQGHRIIGAESAVTVLTERVAELKRNNRRLRGTMSVESQRVDRL